MEDIQKVTAEQVRDVARRYFVPQRLNRVIDCPARRPLPKAEKKAGGGDRGRNPSRAAAQRPARAAETAPHLPLVNIQAFVLGGSLADNEETAGRAALVGGHARPGHGRPLRPADRRVFRFDRRQVSTPSPGDSPCSAALTTLREDFPKAAALFAECFTRPAFPQDEFAKVQAAGPGGDRPPGRRSASRRSASSSATTCRPTRPIISSQGGKTETVERLTAKDLREYHAKYFVPNNMIVTVFGDIDPDEALALVTKHFGS